MSTPDHGPRPAWNQDPHLLLFRRYAKEKGRKASASGLYVVEHGAKLHYVGVNTRMSPLRDITRRVLSDLAGCGLSAWIWTPLDGFKAVLPASSSKSPDQLTNQQKAGLQVVK